MDPILKKAMDKRDEALREVKRWEAWIKEYVELSEPTGALDIPLAQNASRPAKQPKAAPQDKDAKAAPVATTAPQDREVEAAAQIEPGDEVSLGGTGGDADHSLALNLHTPATLSTESGHGRLWPFGGKAKTTPDDLGPVPGFLNSAKSH
jgi:hypothetical protein